MQLVSEIDPMLRNKMETFDFDNNQTNIADLTSEMFEFINDTDSGIGLAAPQVGLDLRLFIMEIENKRYVCVNPEILAYGEEKEINQEGCLSFPNLHIKIKRSSNVTVCYWDENREEQNEELTGLTSRCFQHELDHLNGITFDQRVSKMVFSMSKRRRNKSEKAGGRK